MKSNLGDLGPCRYGGRNGIILAALGKHQVVVV